MGLIFDGISRSLEREFEPFRRAGAQPGRVSSVHPDRASVLMATGVVSARWRRARASGPAGAPAVGDWVAVDPPASTGDTTWMIDAILPRRSKLSRKVAGAQSIEQVVAANVDHVFIVMGLDGDYNLRRLERFATMAWASGAQPTVLLTKADAAWEDLDAKVEAAESVMPGVAVHALSCLEGIGLDALERYLVPGATIALVGSSGVGKSTLINTLVGDGIQRTAAVRAGDDRGRHTTTHRELISLPSGALVIDNPGVRELQLWADDDAAEGLERTFDDIRSLAETCRFRNCSHETEPGCAVRAAIEDGRLDGARLDSQRGLERELRYQALRRDVAGRRAEEKSLSAHYRSVIRAKTFRRR